MDLRILSNTLKQHMASFEVQKGGKHLVKANVLKDKLYLLVLTPVSFVLCLCGRRKRKGPSTHTRGTAARRWIGNDCLGTGKKNLNL